MSVFIKAQEASVSARFWRLRDFSRFSITSVRSPGSMALELATARRMLVRETDTLPTFFLRTMGRLRNEKTRAIVTLGRHTVLPVLKRVSARQQAVLALIQDNPSISRQALADKLGINASAVQKHLDKLKEAGAIERIGGTRGYWQVKV